MLNSPSRCVSSSRRFSWAWNRMAYPSTISVTFSLLPRPSISHFANGHFNLQPPRRHPTASPARRWPERSLASQRPPAPPPPWTPLPAAAPASPRCAPSRTSSATSAPAAPPSSAPSPKVGELLAWSNPNPKPETLVEAEPNRVLLRADLEKFAALCNPGEWAPASPLLDRFRRDSPLPRRGLVVWFVCVWPGQIWTACACMGTRTGRGRWRRCRRWCRRSCRSRRWASTSLVTRCTGVIGSPSSPSSPIRGSSPSPSSTAPD